MDLVEDNCYRLAFQFTQSYFMAAANFGELVEEVGYRPTASAIAKVASLGKLAS